MYTNIVFFKYLFGQQYVEIWKQNLPLMGFFKLFEAAFKTKLIQINNDIIPPPPKKKYNKL